MTWKRILLVLIACGLLYLKHGPVRAPLTEELFAALPEVPEFSPNLDVSRAPLQENQNPPFQVIEAGGFRFELVARFEADARVLSRKNYRFGQEAAFCPVDLALGWGDMAREEILESFRIRQSSRYYHWRTDELPIPFDEVVKQSANMHMIPGSPEVLKALQDVKEGNRVRLAGYLVNVSHPNGLTRNTSTVRTDSGGGGCEIILVLRLEEAE